MNYDTINNTVGCFFSERFDKLTEDQMEDYHRSVFMNMDSAYGAQCRAEYYGTKLRSCGSNLMIGTGVKIINPGNVSIGDNVTICSNCMLYSRSGNQIVIGNKSTIQPGVLIETTNMDGGYIHIGKHVYVGAGSCLYGHVGLEIGDFCLIGQQVTIVPNSHSFDVETKNIRDQISYSKKVVIGNDCYIGMHASILHNASLGDGCVIGAGAVVTRQMPKCAVAIGVPARIVKRRGGW